MYPDVVIHREPSLSLDNQLDTLLNPTVLFEILSDSTEKYDRSAKTAQYRKMDSLQEDVLVSQWEPRVEVYHRRPEGVWRLRESTDLTASFMLAVVSITIPLSEVSQRVEFPILDPSEWEKAGIDSAESADADSFSPTTFDGEWRAGPQWRDRYLLIDLRDPDAPFPITDDLRGAGVGPGLWE